MTNHLTPEALMAKADRACASARALLVLGDVDGACNRAYYAMFDAARAALLASDAPVRSDIGKNAQRPYQYIQRTSHQEGADPQGNGKTLETCGGSPPGCRLPMTE